jgi:hypothetical protein
VPVVLLLLLLLLTLYRAPRPTLCLFFPAAMSTPTLPPFSVAISNVHYVETYQISFLNISVCQWTDSRTEVLYFCTQSTNLMHYLSSVYSVIIPLHVSGLLVAHHRDVTIYICNNWYVLYVPIVAYIHCYLLMMDNL